MNGIMNGITIESMMKPSYVSVSNCDYLRTETFNSKERIIKDPRKDEAISNFRLLEPNKVKSVQLFIGAIFMTTLDAKFHDMSQPLNLFKGLSPSSSDDNKIKAFHTLLLRYTELYMVITPYNLDDSSGYSVDFYKNHIDECNLPSSWDITVNETSYYPYNELNVYNNNFFGLTTALYISIDATGPIKGVTMILTNKNCDDRLDFKYNEKSDMWVHQWHLSVDHFPMYQLPNFSIFDTYRIDINKDDDVQCQYLTVGQEHASKLVCVDGAIGLHYF